MITYLFFEWVFIFFTDVIFVSRGRWTLKIERLLYLVNYLLCIDFYLFLLWTIFNKLEITNIEFVKRKSNETHRFKIVVCFY